MIIGLCVMTYYFDLMINHPLPGRWNEAGAISEIIAVLINFVPARVEDQHIMRADGFTAGFFEIVSGNRFPFFLGHGHHNARAKEMRQRHFINKGRALHNMGGRIDMRGGVHRGGDAL